MVRRTNERRKISGYSMAELPATLYVIFMLLLFPILDLATIGLRYTFVVLATYESAMEAALSSTFEQNKSDSDPSARTAAEDTAFKIARSFSGIRLMSVKTRIVISDLDNGRVSRTEKKLPKPADTTKNLYMLEPELIAQVQPLVSIPFFGLAVPGVTEPITTLVTVRKVSENPQGLNQ